MRVSIVTVCLNNAKSIEDTVRGVIAQDYGDIEYIVVDGGSSDGTADILREYRSRIATCISEPDGGTYDAMNKGISLATGDVVGFLNAGDFYANESALSRVVAAFRETACQAVYGDLEYVAERDPARVVRRWRSQAYRDGLFEKGWHPPHPTFFARRQVFDQYGYFDLRYKISADYELMLRLLKKHGISACHVPQVLVKMRTGGKSNKDLWQIFKANVECYRAWRQNGLAISPLIILRKPASKLIQYSGAWQRTRWYSRQCKGMARGRSVPL